MLHQPTNVIPSMLSGVGDGVIDATKPLTVSWNVSGDTPMVAYRIIIQQNNTASTQMFDTGKVTLSSPFYGHDKNGVQQTFTANTITAAQLSSAGIVNGYANGYKLVITQWWGSSDTSSITQTSPSLFITRATPSLSINTISDPYSERIITVTGSYSQAQGDAISLVRWIFAEADYLNNPIVDTGEIDTSVLQFDYDGLLSGTTYAIRLIVQTSSGVTADTGFVEFSVSYPISDDIGVVRACKPVGQPYVELTWTSRSTIEPTTTGSVSVDNGVLQLGSNSSITYSDLSIRSPWSFAWRGQIGYQASANVLSLKNDADTYLLNVSSNGVVFSKNGTQLFNEVITIWDVDTIVVVVTPNHYYIKQVTFGGGTIPAPDLYPSTTLYPSDVTQVVRNFDGEISYTQSDITEVTMSGEQQCEYLWIENGTFSDLSIEQMIGSVFFEPIYDSSTYLLATFANGNTNAVITGGGGNLLGTSIYRKADNESVLRHVVDIEEGYAIARDYGTKSNMGYQYYIFELGENTYTSTYGSATVTPKFGQWVLMECVYDDSDGAYHVQSEYPFACNVNHGSISNNNNPNKLINFTKYATRQGVSTNYKSGTLSALIGTVNQVEGTYTDSWEIAEEIIALSTNNNPKFLRDMKGAIWQVDTDAAITTAIDGNSPFLPIKITIPWMEVGDASDVSIVALPSDPVFTKDMIYLSTIQLNPETGELMWTVPDAYSGTMLSIKSGNLIATESLTVASAEVLINSRGYLVANI